MTDLRSERRARRHQELSDVTDATALSSDGPPSPPDASRGGEGWLPIDDKARSGSRIEVRSADGEIRLATWHRTRHFDPKTVKWIPTAYWREALAGIELWFEPVEYRPL